MNNEKKFTRGKFEISRGGNGEIFVLSNSDIYISKCTCEINMDINISEANAELICEAFNVATETGMTPLQLQTKIKELESDVKLMVESMNMLIQKRKSAGWDSECAALLAEGTLKHVKNQ